MSTNARVQHILGLDLGSNSVGWAILESRGKKACRVVATGVRIFPRAVEDKSAKPKNQKRRESRMARRISQRRARRKQRMLRYLVSLDLLPEDLLRHPQPEIILNGLGDPYKLRAESLEKALKPHELGRVLLHLVQRRGFLSNKKTLLGDMVDDPDVQDVLADAEMRDSDDKEEGDYKNDISCTRDKIKNSGCRTLGEYLASIKAPCTKRNRARTGGHLRTDRQMYQEELKAIWDRQSKSHVCLTEKVRGQIEEILFYQRPLKLKQGRVGRCSLEPSKQRAKIARLETQRFRYLQQINNLKYFDCEHEIWVELSEDQKERLKNLCETSPAITFPRLRRELGLDRRAEINLETSIKKILGNTTADHIRHVYPEWDSLNELGQKAMVEDLLTIQKKSVLKKRFIDHWKLSKEIAVNLCMVELEPGHSNLSLKAICRLLPYLEKGAIYSDARKEAGYGYESEEVSAQTLLSMPPDIPNPVVARALHELRRVVNAIISEYGKPEYIRLEMARDLEMNTKRYGMYMAQVKRNQKANEEARKKWDEMRNQNEHLALSPYPRNRDMEKYRLWKDQDRRCVYSNRQIPLSVLFGADVEIDHILPFSISHDDSYMNKVVCFTELNRTKGQRTPIDAFGSDAERWNQITCGIGDWGKKGTKRNLRSKKDRFYMREYEWANRDFINSQLNDTRYICREALEYLKKLGSDVSVVKGRLVSWLRHQWNLNSLIGETSTKERTDHRHHAIDAAIIACLDRRLYQGLAQEARKFEEQHSDLSLNDLHAELPWDTFRQELEKSINSLVVSHMPQTKVSGELHEGTGVGYIPGKGTVYRVPLTPQFKASWVDKIIDNKVKQLVKEHVKGYPSPKEAFAPDFQIIHHINKRDEKIPIRRVRILQATTDEENLREHKFGIKNKQGEIFKWHAFGNLHHVEIVKSKINGKVRGRFVTMMEAAHRARGVNGSRRPIICRELDESEEFIMALHKNDMVSIEINGEDKIYRVQKLDRPNRIVFRLHTAATLDNASEMRRETINQKLIDKMKLIKLKVNSIGKRIE